jgi:hypothetical protein
VRCTQGNWWIRATSPHSGNCIWAGSIIVPGSLADSASSIAAANDPVFFRHQVT